MSEQFAGTTENAWLHKELAGLQQAVQKAEAEAQGMKIRCAEKDKRIERLEFKLARLGRELKEVAPNSAWRDVVRLAYAEGGDGARNIQAITNEYVGMHDRLAAIRAAAELVREWLESYPDETKNQIGALASALLAAIDGKPAFSIKPAATAGESGGKND